MISRGLPLLLRWLRVGPQMLRIPLTRNSSSKEHESLHYKTNTNNSDVLDPFLTVNEVHKSFLKELRPPLKRSYNLAAYVNESETLQELIKLGVSLYDIENTDYDAAKYYTTMNFERDCLPHIKFLVQSGLKEKNIGRFISEYPMIFKEHLDDLQTRINYLEAKGFSKKQISMALNRSAMILSFNTKTLDFKLGQLQIEFKLPGTVIRKMIAKYPQAVALPVEQYKLNNFTLTEEFGFTCAEIHRLLEAQPHLLEFIRPVLIERLDLIHNIIGLDHESILRFPKLITGPKLDIKHRAEYLKKLKRNQYDPSQPLYVPPSALYDISDEEFCSKYAKTNLDDYKLFLKSC